MELIAHMRTFHKRGVSRVLEAMDEEELAVLHAWMVEHEQDCQEVMF